jgi:type IV pilus assembly protein PilM
LFENIAAIDVGTHSVKVAIVRTGFRDFQLKSFNHEEIDPDKEDRKAAVVEAVDRILAEERVNGCKVITNLPMEMEIIRNISFPFNDVEKIADAIPYEAEENIPFRLDELILDFQSLKSRKENEGRILLAAVHKTSLNNFIGLLNESSLKPYRMGMESNALFECYRYFNKMGNESVILIDIGNNKTILNFIENDNLLYTRAIQIGVSGIIKEIVKTLKITRAEAFSLFYSLNLDLTSFENNLQRDYYKTLDISRQQLKKIYAAAMKISDELIEQIILTLKAVFVECGGVTFNRALISGGGSNIMGIGSLLSQGLEMPADLLPFLEDYKERNIRTQFPIVFGTLLSYINHPRSSINFLKGEFIPDVASGTRKIYYLSAGFALLAAFILIINLSTSAIMSYRSDKEYNRIISEQFRRYFHANSASTDPIADAMKIYKKEKAELDGITKLMPRGVSLLDLLKDVLTYFPQDSGFVLTNLAYNENILTIDGIAGSSALLDKFKETLLKTKKYESVILNIRYSRQNEVRFTMTVKHKFSSEQNKGGGDQP